MTAENNQASSEADRFPRAFASFRREGIVFGRFGLRAGWGMAAYIAIWLVATVIGSVFAFGASGLMSEMLDARTHSDTSHAPVRILFTSLFVTLNDGIPMLAMLGASWLFARGERRPFSAYGIGQRRWRDAFQGALWGLLLMSALIALLRGFHLLVFEGVALSTGTAVLYGCKWLLAFVLVGGAEEYFFRGYVQYTLMRGLWGLAERLPLRNTHAVAFWMAAGLLSLGFAGMHAGNSGETHLGLFVVFLAGMTFAYALWRTGSLWWAIGFHATWDWTQSFLFGVPDSGNVSVGRLLRTHPSGNPLLSGGPDGPEGSAFVIVALLLAIAVLRRTPHGAQPSPQHESIGAVAHESFSGIS